MDLSEQRTAAKVAIFERLLATSMASGDTRREALEAIAQSGKTLDHAIVLMAANEIEAEDDAEEKALYAALPPARAVEATVDEKDATRCVKCGASTTDGEGYDGLCGSCADLADEDFPDVPVEIPAIWQADRDAVVRGRWLALVGLIIGCLIALARTL